MTLRRIATVAAAAVLATAGTVGVTALPAQAVTCGTGNVCLHDPDRFGTPVWSMTGYALMTNNCTNLTGFNNRVTSWQNTSNYRFVLYADANCSPLTALFAVNIRSSSSNIGTVANDKASSIGWGQ